MQDSSRSAVLAPPAMPKPVLDPPEMAAVRAAQKRLEQAGAELQIRADTAHRYYQAWRQSRLRLGPAGDPALLRTANMEMELFARHAEAIARPAAQAYSDALRRAVLAGSGPTDSLIARLLDVDAKAQSLGFTDSSLLTPADWRTIVDLAARRGLQRLRSEPYAQDFKQVAWCLVLAQMTGLDDLPSVRSLQSILDDLSSAH
jgi:hypothetical protein